MGKQTIFDLARIAAEAEGNLLRHFDTDTEPEQIGGGDSNGSSAAGVLEDSAKMTSNSLLAFSRLGESYVRNYGDPVDPAGFMRTL